MAFEEIAVLGLGYVGLPAAALFAQSGVAVNGMDVSERVCAQVNAGSASLCEPGLREAVRRAVSCGRLRASPHVVRSQAYVIAVPTPVTRDNRADLSHVAAAGESVAGLLKKGDLVVLESTVSPLSTRNVLKPALEQSGLKAGEDFYLAHCPERVLPGNILHELVHNHRVIGGIDRASAQKAADLYGAFVKGEISLTGLETAEMCKLMENTCRDVNIALSNEVAIICENLHIDAWEVIALANRHPRVNLLCPGPGVGGHCLAVDPWFIVEAQSDAALLIRLARNINDYMPVYLFEKIRSLVPRGGKAALLGCTYKADVDDLRESPVMKLHAYLAKDGYAVSIADPYVAVYRRSVYEACAGADIVVLSVGHAQFVDIDFFRIKDAMRGRLVLDCRNFMDARRVREAGLTYLLLGKG